jgi:hypothetical protein
MVGSTCCISEAPTCEAAISCVREPEASGCTNAIFAVQIWAVQNFQVPTCGSQISEMRSCQVPT